MNYLTESESLKGWKITKYISAAFHSQEGTFNFQVEKKQKSLTRYRRVSSKALNTKIDNTTNNTRIQKNKLEESENDMKKSEKKWAIENYFSCCF